MLHTVEPFTHSVFFFPFLSRGLFSASILSLLKRSSESEPQIVHRKKEEKKRKRKKWDYRSLMSERDREGLRLVFGSVLGTRRGAQHLSRPSFTSLLFSLLSLKRASAASKAELKYFFMWSYFSQFIFGNISPSLYLDLCLEKQINSKRRRDFSASISSQP